MENLANIVLIAIGSLMLLGSVSLYLVSTWEGEARAARRSLLVGVLIAGFFFVGVFLPLPVKLTQLMLSLLALLAFTVLLLLPIGQLEDEYPERTNR